MLIDAHTHIDTHSPPGHAHAHSDADGDAPTHRLYGEAQSGRAWSVHDLVVGGRECEIGPAE